ncbi:MAG: molybdopterin-synthase adenylyltransferase MoeB [Candidatus Desantisbacteria bacterium]
MFEFTDEQIRRYSRHIILPEVGGKGQKKLLESSVLLIGAGGLGCPSGYYLAAAGVGKLGFVDFDVVDTSNLQRQILHNTSRINMPKVESAKQTIQALNPDVEVVTYQEKISSSNIMEILQGYDLVLDGCDNFATRYLVNDAAVMSGKTNVSAAVFRFEGQVTVFVPGEGPCYRCLYPEPPPPGMVPSCQEAGVLGVLPGMLGIIQALEAIKLILNIGKSLKGRLLIVDGLGTNFREMKLHNDPNCPLCGKNPTITELADYEEFCQVRF